MIYDRSVLISADSHVIEPPELWQERLDRTWGDRAPHVRRGDDGNDWWWVDGHRSNSFATGSQAGRRFVDATTLVLADRYENVMPEATSPSAYVEANLGDGVHASVLFPTQHLMHYKVRDSALVDACCRAYNDWLTEFCAAEPARLRGVAALNVDDIDVACAEVERVAARGLSAVLVPVSLPHGQSYAHPRFEPLWQVIEAHGMPVCLHIATDRAAPGTDAAPVLAGMARSDGAAPVQTSFATADHWVRRTIGDLIYGGVLECHPDLRVGSIEHEAGWAPYFVERLDYTYTQRATRGHRFGDDRLPSDFWRSQVFVTFSEDRYAIAARAEVGIETLLWASDFPHSEGTFPRSRDIVDAVTVPLGGDERSLVAAGNAARVFGFDLDELGGDADA